MESLHARLMCSLTCSSVVLFDLNMSIRSLGLGILCPAVVEALTLTIILILSEYNSLVALRSISMSLRNFLLFSRFPSERSLSLNPFKLLGIVSGRLCRINQAGHHMYSIGIWAL